MKPCLNIQEKDQRIDGGGFANRKDAFLYEKLRIRAITESFSRSSDFECSDFLTSPLKVP